MFICNKKTPSGFHLQQQYSNIFIIITAATAKKRTFKKEAQKILTQLPNSYKVDAQKRTKKK